MQYTSVVVSVSCSSPQSQEPNLSCSAELFPPSCRCYYNSREVRDQTLSGEHLVISLPHGVKLARLNNLLSQKSVQRPPQGLSP